jgi:hypothetical protein
MPATPPNLPSESITSASIWIEVPSRRTDEPRPALKDGLSSSTARPSAAASRGMTPFSSARTLARTAPSTPTDSDGSAPAPPMAITTVPPGPSGSSGDVAGGGLDARGAAEVLVAAEAPTAGASFVWEAPALDTAGGGDRGAAADVAGSWVDEASGGSFRFCRRQAVSEARQGRSKSAAVPHRFARWANLEREPGGSMVRPDVATRRHLTVHEGPGDTRTSPTAAC